MYYFFSSTLSWELSEKPKFVQLVVHSKNDNSDTFIDYLQSKKEKRPFSRTVFRRAGFIENFDMFFEPSTKFVGHKSFRMKLVMNERLSTFIDIFKDVYTDALVHLGLNKSVKNNFLRREIAKLAKVGKLFFSESTGKVFPKNGEYLYWKFDNYSTNFYISDKEDLKEKKVTQDPCKVEKLKTYEGRKLADGKEFSTTYAFEDDTDTYILEYFHKEQKAVVRMIKRKNVDEEIDNAWLKDDSRPFYYDPYSVTGRREKIFGEWTNEMVAIEAVYMGQAKGSGRCSKAVSYLIKVMLLESAKLNAYPYKGEVYISSSQPCAAVNCYAHAFMNNGFMPDDEELKDFKEDSKNIDPKGKGMYNTFDFEFSGFINKSQKKKYDQMSRKRKRYVSVRTDESEIKLKL